MLSRLPPRFVRFGTTGESGPFYRWYVPVASVRSRGHRGPLVYHGLVDRDGKSLCVFFFFQDGLN